MAPFIQWFVCISAVVGSSLARSTGLTADDETVPIIKEECKKRGYCNLNEVENYPSEIAKQLINNGAIDLNKGLYSSEGERTEDTNTEEKSLCDTTRAIIHPYTLADREGKHHFVVNNGTVYNFNVEICLYDKSGETKYNEYGKFKNDDVKAICVQKYRYIEVDVIENGKHEIMSLGVPGCCTCVGVHITPEEIADRDKKRELYNEYFN